MRDEFSRRLAWNNRKCICSKIRSYVVCIYESSRTKGDLKTVSFLFKNIFEILLEIGIIASCVLLSVKLDRSSSSWSYSFSFEFSFSMTISCSSFACSTALVSRSEFSILFKLIKKLGSAKCLRKTGFLTQNLNRLLDRNFQGRISDRKTEQVLRRWQESRQDLRQSF